MIKRYATKVNKNGLNYQLEIDTDTKEFKYGTFLFVSADSKKTKKELDEIVSLLIADGYKKTNE
jgi:hypothetical protein